MPERKSGVRFHVQAEAVERVAFAYSPLLEAVLSLHVLVAPKHHPLQHEWVRAMRALPPTLKRRIAALSFAYRDSFPDFLLPSPTERFRDFEDELESLLQLDPQHAGPGLPAADLGSRR